MSGSGGSRSTASPRPANDRLPGLATDRYSGLAAERLSHHSTLTCAAVDHCAERHSMWIWRDGLV